MARSIHERGVKAAKLYLSSERELLEVLREQDAIKGYLEFEATSLYDYAHRVLGLPEHTALDLINIARKSHEVPELARAVMSGELTVSKARRIVPVITQDNKSAWLELAVTSTKREIEHAVKTEKPELAVKESARFVAKDRIEFKCGFSEEVYDKFKRVMDLEAQRLQAHANYEKALEAALDVYLMKHDPLIKAERARDRELRAQAKAERDAEPAGSRNDREMRAQVKAERDIGAADLQIDHSATEAAEVKNVVTTAAPAPAPDVCATGSSVRLGSGRVRITARLKHAVTLRDNGRCTFRDKDGVRCSASRWTDIHHLVEVANGGTNALENLTTLCQPHHRQAHR